MMRLERSLAFWIGPATMVLAVMVVPIRAELPTEWYVEMQERAPEFIRVKMTGVKTQKRQKANVTIVRVGAKAKVLKVERSKTGLKEGDAIPIVYTIKVRKRPVPGPRPLRLVKKG